MLPSASHAELLGEASQKVGLVSFDVVGPQLEAEAEGLAQPEISINF